MTSFHPRCLYVGDSVYDMECAQSAGTDSALALWGCHNPDGIPFHLPFRVAGGHGKMVPGRMP